MRHQRTPRAGSAVALVTFCGTLFPAAGNAADQLLDPIVVTATRQATRANELTSDVSVITREEINEAGQSTLEQVLSRQAGIQYTANGGPGTNSGVMIRGASSNQSIVLIDGQRIGSATTGSAALARIPLDQIERIEILRGPASSLYGADAIGGVIQIFTRKGEGPTRLNASTGYGTYGTTDTTVGVSGGTDLVSYSLQAGYLDTGGFNAIHNKSDIYYNPDDDGYRNSNGSASFALRPAAGQEIGVNLLASDGSNQYDSNDFSAVGANKNYTNDQLLESYSIYSRNRLNQVWTSTLRLGTSTDASKGYAGNVREYTIRTDMEQASWQNDIVLPVGEALLAVEYTKQKVSGSTDYTVTERTIRSLLGGWNANIEKHRLQFNLRRDDNSQFGDETTGSASYGYQFSPDWRGHVSYGTAFRAPTFNELYFPSSAFFSGGNPDLQPEQSKNTELGANWERGNHRASLVLYNNNVSDLIEFRPPTYAPVNVSKAVLRGATLTYDGRFSEWRAGVAIDFLDAKNEEDGPNKGNRLARRSAQQMSSYISRTLGDWDLRGEWQLVGNRYDDPANTKLLGGYGLVNLYADYRLQRDWTLFARANNIFDKYYETIDNYATAGANVFVGVRYAPK
ncbi:MAG: Outer membrane cobalamin translocator [Candidatus Accumulibacter appositus]|uniref:Outer membrane cobalamin translocator n=1 Tax=Candidatus Accumulibacter appositus TaxID=1454003 RepID=A0A011PYT2_9PROT|nr:TonB-dependent receptor [Accumulibacter sp.]EXI82030.1 MAG: Outer membrane cobalamin translocator [Candidatus Accumulibacter appositus]HRF04186.1 TonB-dependent receptor [Accumulibacter sp.]